METVNVDGNPNLLEGDPVRVQHVQKGNPGDQRMLVEEGISYPVLPCVSSPWI